MKIKKKKIFLCFNLLFFFLETSAQEIESVKFNDLISRVNVTNDTLYVLNFWATWCAPCVKELPYFEKCDSVFQNKKIKIILVNLDFNSQLKKTAEPFIKNKNIKSKVVHITDTDPDTWINKIDSLWSGAIPATVMYRQNKKVFFKEGSMKEEELSGVLKMKSE